MVPHLNELLHGYLQLLIVSWKLMPFAAAGGLTFGMMRREAAREARARAWLRGDSIR